MCKILVSTMAMNSVAPDFGSATGMQSVNLHPSLPPTSGTRQIILIPGGDDVRALGDPVVTNSQVPNLSPDSLDSSASDSLAIDHCALDSLTIGPLASDMLEIDLTVADPLPLANDLLASDPLPPVPLATDPLAIDSSTTDHGSCPQTTMSSNMNTSFGTALRLVPAVSVLRPQMNRYNGTPCKSTKHVATDLRAKNLTYYTDTTGQRRIMVINRAIEAPSSTGHCDINPKTTVLVNSTGMGVNYMVTQRVPSYQSYFIKSLQTPRKELSKVRSGTGSEATSSHSQRKVARARKRPPKQRGAAVTAQPALPPADGKNYHEMRDYLGGLLQRAIQDVTKKHRNAVLAAGNGPSPKRRKSQATVDEHSVDAPSTSAAAPQESYCVEEQPLSTRDEQELQQDTVGVPKDPELQDTNDRKKRVVLESQCTIDDLKDPKESQCAKDGRDREQLQGAMDDREGLMPGGATDSAESQTEDPRERVLVRDSAGSADDPHALERPLEGHSGTSAPDTGQAKMPVKDKRTDLVRVNLVHWERLQGSVVRTDSGNVKLRDCFVRLDRKAVQKFMQRMSMKKRDEGLLHVGRASGQKLRDCFVRLERIDVQNDGFDSQNSGLVVRLGNGSNYLGNNAKQTRNSVILAKGNFESVGDNTPGHTLKSAPGAPSVAQWSEDDIPCTGEINEVVTHVKAKLHYFLSGRRSQDALLKRGANEVIGLATDHSTALGTMEREKCETKDSTIVRWSLGTCTDMQLSQQEGPREMRVLDRSSKECSLSHPVLHFDIA